MDDFTLSLSVLLEDFDLIMTALAKRESTTLQFPKLYFNLSCTSSHSSILIPRTKHSFSLSLQDIQLKMAPTKEKATGKPEKEAKLTPEQSATLILDYLRKQNRPYSATDISANLKNRVTKAAAAKLLKDLHERNEIEGKAAGKQIVYHAIQVSLTPSPILCLILIVMG